MKLAINDPYWYFFINKKNTTISISNLKNNIASTEDDANAIKKENLNNAVFYSSPVQILKHPFLN